MIKDYCFKCNSELKSEVCSKCGYVFPFNDELKKCPRLINHNSVICVMNRKVCTCRNFEECLIFRAND